MTSSYLLSRVPYRRSTELPGFAVFKSSMIPSSSNSNFLYSSEAIRTILRIMFAPFSGILDCLSAISLDLGNIRVQHTYNNAAFQSRESTGNTKKQVECSRFYRQREEDTFYGARHVLYLGRDFCNTMPL